MEKFIYINTIKFNNKLFNVYTSKKYPLYMLEIKNNNKLSYPTYEDYTNYLKLRIKENLNIIFEKDDDSFKRNSLKKKFIQKIVPKVIYKGVFISLSSALLLSGCGIQATSVREEKISNTNAIENNIDEKDNIIEKQNEENVEKKEKHQSVAEIIENTYQKKIIEENKKRGYDVYFSEYNEPFLHEFNCENFGGDSIFCRDIDEFKNLINDHKEYTYEDVKQEVINNNSIPEEYKTWLINGLKNMEKELPNLDLTILNYNLKRIRFVEKTEEEIKEVSIGKETVTAAFNMKTGEVKYNPNSKNFGEFTIDHEVLGHATTEAIHINDNNKRIYYGFYTIPLKTNDEGISVPYGTGTSYSEGTADTIARIASGQTQNSVYNYAEEEIRLIADLCNIEIEELINKRGIQLIEIMHNNNVDNPVEHIIYSDELLKNYKTQRLYYGTNNVKMEEIIESLIYDFTEEDAHNKNTIDNTVSIMQDTLFEDGIELYYYDTSGNKIIADSYNPYESSQNIKEQLEDNQTNAKKR